MRFGVVELQNAPNHNSPRAGLSSAKQAPKHVISTIQAVHSGWSWPFMLIDIADLLSMFGAVTYSWFKFKCHRCSLNFTWRKPSPVAAPFVLRILEHFHLLCIFGAVIPSTSSRLIAYIPRKQKCQTKKITTGKAISKFEKSVKKASISNERPPLDQPVDNKC